MRIEQNQKMDANVVVTGNARQDNVAAAKKDASIVRIEKDRKEYCFLSFFCHSFLESIFIL